MYQLDPLSTFEIILIAVVVVLGVSFIPAIIGAVVGVLLARITPGVRPLMGGVVGAVGGPLVVLISFPPARAASLRDAISFPSGAMPDCATPSGWPALRNLPSANLCSRKFPW